jgi:hypothetical protein
MTGAQASVLQLVLARAPVVFKENKLLFNRLDLELQTSDYYFIVLFNHIPARAPILQLLLARAPVLATSFVLQFPYMVSMYTIHLKFYFELVLQINLLSMFLSDDTQILHVSL